MREIKFRAWDNRRKVMLYDVSIDYQKYINKSFAVEWGYMLSTQPTEGELLELMQYTGLKDKSGREIWESDLYGDTESAVYQIVWAEEIGRWDFKRLQDGELMLNFNDIDDLIYDSNYLGNIYENPELLNP